MKKFIIFVILIIFVVFLVACQNQAPQPIPLAHQEKQVQEVPETPIIPSEPVVSKPVAQEQLPAETVTQPLPETQQTAKETESTTPTDIYVEAYQFGYEPSIIKLKLGDRVNIHLSTRDVPHSMQIPQLGFIVNAAPETPGVRELVASKQGTFTWFCSIPCGSGHGDMEGKLVIE